ncbi:hypothetical protein K6I33_003013 [Streptomyces sp. UNOB3_S3]|nr:hypothetical protein [Streptomyces sp. UNOB3_S3]
MIDAFHLIEDITLSFVCLLDPIQRGIALAIRRPQLVFGHGQELQSLLQLGFRLQHS